ncbi:MAG: site-specific integrase, partial [Oscillospiraceae bacterium]
ALKRAVWDKLILENPMKKQSGFKMPKSQKDTKDIVALDLNEEIRLIAALKEFRSKPHPENYNDYTPQIIISLFTGMRMGEINALELSDINFERRKIKISKTISRGEKYESVVKNGTKTYAGKREVDLNIELQYILKDYILKVYPEVKGKGKDESINLLFLNKKSGGIITTNQVSTWLKEFCKKNEISNKVITSHVLRHTYATRCIESGMQIKVLQKLLGHEDVTTTINTYCDVFTEYEDENIETAQRYFKEKKLTFSDEQEPNN